MRLSILRLVTACLAVASVEPLGATVFVPGEWSELVVASGAIAHGRIVEVRPQVAADRRRVETIVALQVATYLKGDWGARVTFRVPGGRIGRYQTIVLDAPTFVPGEEVVLLLGARGPSVPYVLGLSHGVFRVTRDPRSGERLVAPVPVVGEGGDWRPVVRGDRARGPLALTEFAGQVRQILAVRP